MAAGPLSAQEAAKGGAARERIAYIEKALIDGEKNARIWWGLWIAAYAGLSAGQYALAGVADSYGRKRAASTSFETIFITAPGAPSRGRSSGSIISSAGQKRRCRLASCW